MVLGYWPSFEILRVLRLHDYFQVGPGFTNVLMTATLIAFSTEY